MTASRVACFGALLCAILSGCARAPHARGEHAFAPNGLVIPAAAKPGDDVGGIYVGGAAGSGVWLAPEATLVLRKERHASRLALVVYVPDQTERQRTWYHAHPLRLSGAFPGAPVQVRCCFSGGVASAAFNVPSALRDARGVLRFRVRIWGALAPPEIASLRGDRRRLALVLVRLFFY